MKNIITILSLLLTFTSYAQEKKCSHLKIGKFEYSNPVYSEWKIIRTDSTQIEKNSKSGIEIYSSIEWKSDCLYVLTYKKILNSDPKDFIGRTVQVEITEIKSDRYTCESKSDIMDLKLEIVKIN